MNKPQQSFQSECPACLHILREPYQVNCCGYAFCRVCIDSIDSDKGPCPCCNNTTYNKFEDKGKKRSLYAFKVYCSNKKQGCQWVGELGQLDNHLNLNPSQQNQLQGCQLSQIKCLYCSELFLRSDIDDHQNNQCLRRSFNCEYCIMFKSTFEKVANHWLECGSFPIPCTNKCGETLQRQNLESHIANDCPQTIINCDFEHVGCQVRLPRIDMPVHLGESVVCHLSLLGAGYKKLLDTLQEEKQQARREITTLRQRNQQLTQQISKLTEDNHQYIFRFPICPCRFTITNYEQRKAVKEDWLSLPFYSHPGGYKMCLEVCTNFLVVVDRRRFVAVFIRLMKGEFDSKLKWPFSGKIHVTLKSQGANTEDLEQTIDINDHQIVKSGDISRNRCGIKDFVSHDSLGAYKNNDCLNFSVDTDSDTKYLSNNENYRSIYE